MQANAPTMHNCPTFLPLAQFGASKSCPLNPSLTFQHLFRCFWCQKSLSNATKWTSHLTKFKHILEASLDNSFQCTTIMCNVLWFLLQVLGGEVITPWLGACMCSNIVHMDSHKKPTLILGHGPNISCVDTSWM
jgi:hypothetical protein